MSTNHTTTIHRNSNILTVQHVSLTISCIYINFSGAVAGIVSTMACVWWMQIGQDPNVQYIQQQIEEQLSKMKVQPPVDFEEKLTELDSLREKVKVLETNKGTCPTQNTNVCTRKEMENLTLKISENEKKMNECLEGREKDRVLFSRTLNETKKNFNEKLNMTREEAWGNQTKHKQEMQGFITQNYLFKGLNYSCDI